MRFRLLTSAMVLFSALALRAATGQEVGPSQEAPPRTPFGGARPDPYFPRPALPPNQPGVGQRLPIVNQPQPIPRLGFVEEGGEAPVATPRPPLVKAPGQESGIAPTLEEGLAAPSDEFLPGRIVARVGDEIILYGDVASLVDQGMAPELAKVRNKYQKAELEARRDQTIRMLTRQLAEKKLQYVEFRRMIAAKAKDKLPEAEKDLNKNVKNAFDKSLADAREKMAAAAPKQVEEMLRGGDIVIPRLALLMKENNLETTGQLDEVLRGYGSSVEKQLAMFREHNLGQQAVIDKLGKKAPEITYHEMLKYYRDHADKYAVPAKARFEILTVLFSRFPDRISAKKQIAEMGDSVFFGRPFDDVAKKFSQEPNAAKGGQYDWTGKGSLASEVIDTAIFSLPLNKLSQILEDDRGYHIIRVLERKEPSRVPFFDAQTEIKEILQKTKRDAKVKVILESLKKETTIWTIYDQPEVSQQGPPAGKTMK